MRSSEGSISPPHVSFGWDLVRTHRCVRSVRKCVCECLCAQCKEVSECACECLCECGCECMTTCAPLTPAAFDAFRTAAGWRGASLLFPDVWNPSLNFTDPEYGNSEGFFNAYKAGSTSTDTPLTLCCACLVSE